MKFAQEMGTSPDVIMKKVQSLQARAARGALDPSETELFNYLKQRGLVSDPQAAAGPSRDMVANALQKRAADFRPVERDPTTGMPAPPLDSSGYTASKRYGGSVGSGVEGVPPTPLSPDDLAQHYAEQQMLQEAGQPIGNTSISGGGRVTAPADTEVRPWAQRTPAGYKDRGLNPGDAPLQPQRRSRGAPITYPSAATADDEAILRMLMGQ